MSSKSGKKIPVVVVKNTVLFPNIIVPFAINNKFSINAVNSANLKFDDNIVIVLQSDLSLYKPEKKEHLHRIGVLAKVLQVITIDEYNIRVLVDVIERVSISEISFIDDVIIGICKKETVVNDKNDDLVKLIPKLIKQFIQYCNLRKSLNQNIDVVSFEGKDANTIANVISSNIDRAVANKQAILEENDLLKKVTLLIEFLQKDIVSLKIEIEVENKFKEQIEKSQKEFLLREKINYLQKELDKANEVSDISKLENKLKKKKIPLDTKEKILSEMRRCNQMPIMSPESSVIRNYVDVLLSLPWGDMTKQNISIEQVVEILDQDHYGLKKVKERIIEYVAVLKKTSTPPNSTLLFVGPSGVGKTSLAKSIAKSLNREYVKCSLGGVSDESEIRGHRRTYIASMPGKIISALRKVKKDNPVILLDEIDKLITNFRGDPSSALLEVLDSNENKKFIDNYLEIEYDLSNVMFICTANSLNIQKPLLDRMEIIRLSGYTEEEKLHIAKNYLIKKQLNLCALSSKELRLTDQVISEIIRSYTKEAGVRDLERNISAIMRKTIRMFYEKNKTNTIVRLGNLKDLLGAKKYSVTNKERQNVIASTPGLAYTEYGGDLLFVEAVLTDGSGKLKTTGKLGDVIKESSEIAFSYFKANAKQFSVKKEKYTKQDVHIHFPEGATPKDGPSAGIAIFNTIVSLMTNIKVNSLVAMTGEITLRGTVLPIGGVKEKIYAAQRSGIEKVILPYENQKDLEEISNKVKQSMQIVFVKHVNEILPHSLEKSAT